MSQGSGNTKAALIVSFGSHGCMLAGLKPSCVKDDQGARLSPLRMRTLQLSSSSRAIVPCLSHRGRQDSPIKVLADEMSTRLPTSTLHAQRQLLQAEPTSRCVDLNSSPDRWAEPLAKQRHHIVGRPGRDRGLTTTCVIFLASPPLLFISA